MPSFFDRRIILNNDIWIKTEDDTNVYIKKWFTPNIEPKAIVQLSHGMVEHINRYHHFAEFLLSKRILVYGNDHRGHGYTGEKQGLFGYFSKTDGFDKTTNDLVEVTQHIREDYPDTPIYLLGHSMGSFLARRYIQEHSHLIDGLILSGTGYYPPLIAKLGQILASTQSPTEKSQFMNNLTIGNNNKAIKQANTSFDWLTRDEQVVQAYIDDPYTGFIPTGRFFYDLMSGLTRIHKNHLNAGIRYDLPILLISGDADPVGQNGKGVFKTGHLFEKAGVQDITIRLYENGRHEILNEINQHEVYQDIYHWISHRLPL